MSNRIDFIIMAAVGVFFTLLGFEIISFGKPDSLDTERLKKWQSAQKFYRLGGPVIFVCGVVLWLFNR